MKKQQIAKYLFIALIIAGIASVSLAVARSFSIIRDQSIGDATPQRITAASLLENGPGPNRHVTVTDFTVGGYVMSQVSKSRSESFLVASPTGISPGTPGKSFMIHVTKFHASDETIKNNISEYTGIYTQDEYIRPVDQKTLGPQYPGMNFDSTPHLEVRTFNGGKSYKSSLWFGGVGIVALTVGIIGAVVTFKSARASG